MSDKGAEFLKQGRKSCKEIEAAIREWKTKAIEAVPEAPPKRAAHTTGASEVEARATDASGGDAGKKVR